MFIFLYGQDTYRSRQKLKEIILHYKNVHPGGMNLKFYDAREICFQDFRREFQQTSMFRGKKLIVIENFFANSRLKEDFLKNKKIFLDSDDIVIFFEQNKIVENDSLTKFLKENGKFQRFDLLSGRQLKSWLKKEFIRYGVKTSEKALEKFADFVGNDLYRLSSEIKKLVSYKNYGEIQENDVEFMVNPRIETAIFETIESIAQRNKIKALRLIENHLKKGDSPFYLLKMISYQFRNLLLVKCGNPYGVGLHPFVMKKALGLAKSFSLAELKSIYQRLSETDLNIKTGKVTPEEGVKMLIAEI